MPENGRRKINKVGDEESLNCKMGDAGEVGEAFYVLPACSVPFSDELKGSSL